VNSDEDDWIPIASSPDRLGLKKTYQRGIVPAELTDDAKLLLRIGAEQPFRDHGYDLPWMRREKKV
jgi:hypothetical protein